MPSRSSTTLILDNISQNSKRPLKCPSGKWKAVKRGGIEVCIDQRLKRMAKITMALNNGDLPGTTAEGSSTQRQGAMTEIFRDDAMPGGGGGGGTGGKCKKASGCSLGPQAVTCDKTSFMIDVSGSMSWYGGRRLAAAKRELLKVISECSDDAEINVTAWSSSGYFERKIFSTPQKLTQANRDLLRKSINGFYGYGGTDPGRALDANIQDPKVKEIVVLSDGQTYPRPYGYKRIGRLNCGYGAFANCYKKYNDTYRSNNPVVIKTVSLDLNFCGNQWMGQLADLNGGSCVHTRR